jgi:hypothetical protein
MHQFRATLKFSRDVCYDQLGYRHPGNYSRHRDSGINRVSPVSDQNMPDLFQYQTDSGSLGVFFLILVPDRPNAGRSGIYASKFLFTVFNKEGSPRVLT